MKRALATAVVLVSLAFAGTASAASTWTGNTFKNPSGNITCHYYHFAGHTPAIVCEVKSNRHAAVLNPNSSFTYSKGTPYTGAMPVLRYGDTWKSHQFTCLSSYSGMRCWNGADTHGFFVSAYQVNSW